MEYRRDIDGMRALAVLAVVLCHAGVAGLAGGFAGVDVFFVVSGYLICGIIARELAAGTFSLLDFYERRVRRILPPLLLVIAVCFAAGWFLLPPPAYEGLARSAISATLFWSNIWFRNTGEDYFAAPAAFEPLLHTWSLSVEEQFYLAVPLAMWLAWRINPRLLLPGVLLASAASFGWSLKLLETSPSSAFYLFQSRAWELGVGAALAWRPWRGAPPRWLAELAGLGGLAAIALTFVLLDESASFPAPGALPAVLGAALLLWSGERETTLAAKALALPPLVWIGLISYSLYLWHWPALVLARQLYLTDELPLVATVIALGAALVLATASTALVERPLRRRGPGALIGRRAAFALALVAALALVGLAGLTALRDGFWSRAPGLQQVVAEATQQTALELSCRDSWREHGQPCRFGAAGAQPQVLLWGDSHAGALLPGLEQELHRRGLAGAATITSSCPPLPGVRRTPRGGDFDCYAINRAVLAYLDANPDALRTVILHARWSGLFARRHAEGGGKRRPPLVDVATGQPLARADLPRALGAATAGLVDRLTASGRRVILIAGVPQMRASVPGLVLAERFHGMAAASPRPLTEVRRQEAEMFAVLRAVSSRPGAARGVTLIDPVAVICAAGCPYQSGGGLLYRDNNHLSAHAARIYVPLLLEGVEL